MESGDDIVNTCVAAFSFQVLKPNPVVRIQRRKV